MIFTRIMAALARATQLQKLLNSPKAQAYLSMVKAWYERQPKKVRIIVGVGIVAAVGAALFV